MPSSLPTRRAAPPSSARRRSPSRPAGDGGPTDGGRGVAWRVVLVGAAVAAVTAAAASCEDRSEEYMERRGYASLDDCARDWGGPQECQQTLDPDAVAVDGGSGASGIADGDARSGGARLWWGPYYTRAGRVYRLDGTVGVGVPDDGPTVAARASAWHSRHGLGDVTRGAYAGQSERAAVARGGFGGTGRWLSSSG